VSYTAVMFVVVTIFTAINLHIQSISFIDNREFPGVDGVAPPGPLGYQLYIYSQPITIVPNSMFLLNNWLADGLLLYRCYIVYAANFWIIAFPCLIYLASVAMGITFVYQTSQPNSSVWNATAIDFGLPYFSISLSLNIILTILIVTRLVLHSRNVRAAMGAPGGAAGLYKAIVTMLIESCALYAVNSILFVAPWGAGSHVADIFLPILAETQVIAPFLIIQRVANQSALTGDSVVTGNPSSFNFRSQGKTTDGSGTLPGGYPGDSKDESAKGSSELGIGVNTTLEFHDDNKA